MRWNQSSRTLVGNAKGCVFVFLSLLIAGMATGCLAAPDPLDCEPYPSDDRNEVYSFVNRKWEQQIERPYNGSDWKDLSLKDLGIQDPARLEGSEGIYIDWEEYPIEERPELVHDALCLSAWRRENIDALREGDFWTNIGTANAVIDDSLTMLDVERDRQNPGGNGYCCYVLFRGNYYGVTTSDSISTH